MSELGDILNKAKKAKAPKAEKASPAVVGGLMEGIDPAKLQARTYRPGTGKLGTLAQALKSAALAVEPGQSMEHPIVLDIRDGLAIVGIPLQYPAPSRDATALFITQGSRSHAAMDVDGVIHADVPIKCSIGLGHFARQRRDEEGA